jgi:hypothetical protein
MPKLINDKITGDTSIQTVMNKIVIHCVVALSIATLKTLHDIKHVAKAKLPLGKHTAAPAGRLKTPRRVFARDTDSGDKSAIRTALHF